MPFEDAVRYILKAGPMPKLTKKPAKRPRRVAKTS
jgi:hypothetical protein